MLLLAADLNPYIVPLEFTNSWVSPAIQSARRGIAMVSVVVSRVWDVSGSAMWRKTRALRNRRELEELSDTPVSGQNPLFHAL